MKKIPLLSAILLNCIALVISQGKVEIDGVLIIGNLEDTTLKAGTMRWSGTDFEGWNGERWISLTGSGYATVGSVTDIDGNI